MNGFFPSGCVASKVAFGLVVSQVIPMRGILGRRIIEWQMESQSRKHFLLDAAKIKRAQRVLERQHRNRGQSTGL